jgi:ADP-heptose:LPS heptosyltransferase
MLTAAVRDLHVCYPGQFVTDVRTSCPELWEHNSYLTHLEETASDVEIIDCQYPLIHQSNAGLHHFIQGFSAFLADRLGLEIHPMAMRGDIHLSGDEKSRLSQVNVITGDDTPFWIIVAGGKTDFTIKWWDHERFQQVVDYFDGRIRFVQVGQRDHFHPALSRVIDLRGATSLRQLVLLTYHAQGVLCPVTLMMHLAAAVEVKQTGTHDRPCVVVAGGREPPHWEAYPTHQFIHTVGALVCCKQGGCWRSRTFPLGDGDDKDNVDSLCINVVGHLPQCMHMISASDVIRRIELYFEGGLTEYINRE